ncbi:MAG: hypothetical protein HY652_09075 [Acidobacteria bacterium]|nr:hypothetical protein [Acidobacteriota bacterium]
MSATLALASQWTGAVICVLLVTIGIAEHQLGLPASVSHTLSVLLILAGVGWAVRGPQRLRRLSELYLWLAFILTLRLYEVLSHRIAALIETDRFVVYCVVSAIHLLLIIATLGVLGAWTRGKTPAEAKSQLAGLAAGLFIVGAVIFWIGAMSFPGMRLEGIAANQPGHFLTSATFLVATVISLAGLTFFTLVLREAGDRFLSILGLVAFLFGAVFWVTHLAFRLTVMVSAAQEMARTAVPPPWYEPWYRWSGLLFGIYHVLAYLALVAYGAAVLKTALLARWVGWICIIFALVSLPFFGAPLAIHVVPWLLGVFLLQHRSQQKTNPL